MANRTKNIKRTLIVILLFALVFVLTYTMLLWVDQLPQSETLSGEEIAFKSYTETIDGAYIGEFLGDEFNGKGQFDFVSNEIYVGEWSESQMTGDGKMIFPSVGTYQGEYAQFARNGKGTFNWDNGDQYEGEWTNDKISGEGTYTYADGNYLKGEFNENKFLFGVYHITKEDFYCEITVENSAVTNRIKLVLDSGVEYTGLIENGKINGNGTITYKDGSEYSGMFEDNKRHGFGTYTWSSGECYEGNWKNNKMSGQGTYYYSSKGINPKLTGEFSNGVPTGECTYYESYFATYITTWKNGKCVRVAED